MISPLFALAVGISPYDSAGLLAVLALIVAIWNGVYSSAFDWAECTLTGRSADRRPPMLRALHAAALELGAVGVTTPVIAIWTGVPWTTALFEDVGLTFAYAVYAYIFFGILYDRAYPIARSSDDVCGSVRNRFNLSTNAGVEAGQTMYIRDGKHVRTAELP